MMDEFKALMDKMADTVSVVSGKYDFAFFIILRSMGKRCVLEWCMSMGLIPHEVVCKVCNEPMKLTQRADTTDGFVWICRIRKGGTKHYAMKSVRTRSFFQCSRTSIINILMLTYLWVKNVSTGFIVDELGIGRRTVLEWLDYLREFCLDMCVHKSTLVGGPNVVIELVECKFGKKKYFKGSRLHGKWMYGGTEVNTGKFFVELVEVRSKKSLLNVLEKYVLPGTIIVSDCWKEYKCKDDDDFMLLAANRGLAFKNPSTECSEKSIFSLKAVIKHMPYGHRRSIEQYDGHLAEFMWRRFHSGNPSSMFQTFLSDLISIFPTGAIKGASILSTQMGPKIKIGTHNGTFHCDEVLACTLLKYAKPEYSSADIIRSRDSNILNECDIVVDVGGTYDASKHRYDHHQRTFNETMNSLNKDYPWTIKLSSAGLVYFHFGHQIISKILNIPEDSEETKVLFSKIYENFIQEIDAIDNGIDPCDGAEPRYSIHTHLSARVKHLNPAWNEPNQDETECFQKASQLVEEEFISRVKFYGKTWLPAREIVKKAVLDRKSLDPSGEIIEFSNGGCPWKEHLFELEKSLKVEETIKYVLYPGLNSDWRVQCVSVSPFSFENRLSMKEEWRGLRDEELSKVSGIPGCIFVHASGFTGGNKTRDGALQMALKCLQK